MAESALGVKVAATRQNAGRFGIGVPEGGVNVPAGTSSAAVIAVCGDCN
jgi:hypothetical protein